MSAKPHVWRSSRHDNLVYAAGPTLAEAFVALVAELQENDEEKFLIDLRFDVDDWICLTAVLERYDDTPVAVAP